MQPGTLSIDGDRVHVPATVFDHEGFRRWVKSDEFPESASASFIDGEVLFDMSPESFDSHNKPKLKLTEILSRIVDEDDLGESFADRMLLTNEEAALSTEPDFIFASWEAFQSGRLRLIGKTNRADDAIEIDGTPDLVVEIISDSSIRKDTKLLRAAYHRAGIPEYWLIDARTDISFVILQRREDRYEPSAPDGEPQRSVILARSFRLSRSKNRLSRWRYRLDVVG